MPARKRPAASGKKGAAQQPAGSPKKTTSRKKPQKLGFTIAVRLPTVSSSRQADIAISDKGGAVAATERGDLGDGRERTRLANKLLKQFQKGTREQWEAAFQQAHLQALEQRQAEEQQARENPPPSDSPCSPCSVYRIEGGRICMTRHTPAGDEVIIPLSNFTAVVPEMLCVDDGSGDVERYFTIVGALDNGTPLPRVTLRAADFMVMNWPVTSWGLRAIITPGQGCRDHLRAAIQWFSDQAVERTIYKHTGWRKIAGVWHYLHANGAISARGVNSEVAVDLSGPLARYALPVPPTGDDLRKAVRASLRLHSFAPRLFVPILGQVYRAVLSLVEWSLQVVGHTGLGKSEIIALAQQHFGPEMNRLNLPASWQSTGNALVELAFLAKDAVLVIDDFKPAGSRSAIDQMHQLAERVLRAQGNHSGRARCRADGSVKAPRPPRAAILSSGEDSLRGESLQARTFTLHVTKDDIDVRQLTPFQQDAAQGFYAAAMSAYLCWLAGRFDEVRASLDGERSALRQKAMSSKGHARTPGIVADLALGWKYFLAFAVDTDVISPGERDQIACEVWDILLQVAARQDEEIGEQDPAVRFLKLLNAVLSSGRAHVTSREGLEPAEPLLWGWRADASSGEGANVQWKPQGKQVGWVEDEDLYLDGEATYAEVQRLGDEQGERLALSKSQLGKHLKTIGALRSSETDKTTTRRTLQGRERVVWHLAAAALLPPKTGGTGGTGRNNGKTSAAASVSSPCFQNGNGKQGEETGGFAREKQPCPPVPPVLPVSEEVGQDREVFEV